MKTPSLCPHSISAMQTLSLVDMYHCGGHSYLQGALIPLIGFTHSATKIVFDTVNRMCLGRALKFFLSPSHSSSANFTVAFFMLVSFTEQNLKMRRKFHSYDIRSSAKRGVGGVSRFLGYDTSSVTESLTMTKHFGQFLDFMLLILLVIIWKPFALLCIYVEICFWASWYTLASLVFEIYELYPIISLSMGLFAPDLALICTLSSLAMVQKITFLGFSKHNKSVQVFECLSCLWSISLLMRFLSGGPSSATLRKHDRLARNSMLYRVFRHMI